MSVPTVVQINANWPDLTPDQYDRLIEYGKTCVLAGAAAEGAPLLARIAELEGIVDAYRNTRDEHLQVIAKLRADLSEAAQRGEGDT